MHYDIGYPINLIKLNLWLQLRRYPCNRQLIQHFNYFFYYFELSEKIIICQKICLLIAPPFNFDEIDDFSTKELTKRFSSILRYVMGN